MSSTGSLDSEVLPRVNMFLGEGADCTESPSQRPDQASATSGSPLPTEIQSITDREECIEHPASASLSMGVNAARFAASATAPAHPSLGVFESESPSLLPPPAHLSLEVVESESPSVLPPAHPSLEVVESKSPSLPPLSPVPPPDTAATPSAGAAVRERRRKRRGSGAASRRPYLRITHVFLQQLEGRRVVTEQDTDPVLQELLRQLLIHISRIFSNKIKRLRRNLKRL